MTVLGDGESTGLSRFNLTLSPANNLASKTEMASGGVANVTLTDDAGNAYEWLSTRTRWSKSQDSRAVEWQQLTFQRVPPGSVSTLALDITGGGTVVGPFVFKDVRLVSGDSN